MKRFLTMLLAAFLICGLFSAPAHAEEERWWEQDLWSVDVLLELGAELPTYNAAEQRYEIETPEQLLYLSGIWKPEDTNGDGAPDAPCNGTYVLTADLDMAPLNEKIGAVLTEKSGTETKGYMPPIGALADADQTEGVHCAFFGTFDGQNHAIKNLRVVRMGQKYCGLFGNIGHDFGEGYAKDLAILDAEIVGLSSCGILAGGLYGDADNIVCTGTIDCMEKNAGGLAAKIKKNDNGYVGVARNCFVYCDILVRGTGNENGAAGGITASCSGGGQVMNCFAAGSIKVLGEEADSVGGIVGNLKGGTAVDGNVMLLKLIDGGENSQNVGFLCGNYSGESGSHIHNNFVFDGTKLLGGVSSSHPEAAAFTLASADEIKSKALYAGLGWDFDEIWSWIGDENDGCPMLKAFAGTVDLTERIHADLTIDKPVLMLSEPTVNSMYAEETVPIAALLKLPEGMDAADATLYVGTSKKRSACTETMPMQQTETGFAADLSLPVGTYYYYCSVDAGGEKLTFPTEGTMRLDVVSPTMRYLPEQITLTPGATVSEMCLNWITAADGLTASLKWREVGASDWQTLPVTEIERVNVLGDHGTFTSYSADLKDLKPGTDYEYMAVTNDGTADYQSGVYRFRTLPAGNAFSFVLVSDLQSTNEEGYLPWLYTQKTFLTDTLHPDFIVNLGDLTEDDTMAEWGFLFDKLSETLASTPTAFVPGNHESKGDVIYSHFKGRTNLPDGVDDPMLAENTASFIVGDVCFVILNTEPYTGVDGTDASQDKLNFYALQKTWAKEVFDASGCSYRIVLAHAGLVQKDPAATAFLEQMCDELDVDLFFNGHIHNYFRATVDGTGSKAEIGDATTFVTTSPMGMKFDEYGGEIDDLLDFQTGGKDDERQYLTYVEVREDGITVTAYQRTESGDASLTKCADYTAIDTFTIHREACRSAPDRTWLWITLGCAAALIAGIIVWIVLRKRKRTEPV
ncbi:MAG: metallophosphoesterase family protein [Clostridia bacterium]|nr:metallophosphoesterase family protein [Clostridia bacterium]